MTGHVSFRAWRAGELDTSVHLGTVAGPAGLSFEEPVGVRSYVDPHTDDPSRRTYEWAAWLSPAVTPGHPFTTLVPSWNARTPERYPDLIVQARSEQDVVAAVHLAGVEGMAIGIRAGGLFGHHLHGVPGGERAEVLCELLAHDVGGRSGVSDGHMDPERSKYAGQELCNQVQFMLDA